MPVYHRALARRLERPHPIAVLNLGGVANITFIDGENDPIACDTGPANALIDDFMRARKGATRDEDGQAAAAGRVDEAAIARLLAHPFFARPCRNRSTATISAQWVGEHAGLAEKSTEDGAATLTMLTAASVARIVAVLPRPPQSWIVAGGGARNPTLVRHAGRATSPGVGRDRGSGRLVGRCARGAGLRVPGGALAKGLPLTFPTTTGAPRPMTGGVLVKALAA